MPIDKTQEILESAKKWFREVIAVNHISNTRKLSDPAAFNINPFLVKYLARFLTGKSDAYSIAKALIYPRILGTSITTSFGQNSQKFTNDVLGSFGSVVPGIDIEFIDQIDGRKKYCQVKLGPNCINKDDVKTVHGHFSGVRNLAKTNHVKIELTDLIIGVLYGEKEKINAHYKNLEKNHHYPIYVAGEFWERVTGSKNFYSELSSAISEIAIEHDGSKLLEETIIQLSSSPFIKNISD